MSTWAPSPHVVTNGEEAMRYVCQKGVYAGSPRPDLIILDINLPKLSGLEVLEKVKEIPARRQIPIIMLSTSNAEVDVQAAYDLHANVYLVKAAIYDGIVSQFENIEMWLNFARLPFNPDDVKSDTNPIDS